MSGFRHSKEPPPDPPPDPLPDPDELYTTASFQSFFGHPSKSDTRKKLRDQCNSRFAHLQAEFDKEQQLIGLEFEARLARNTVDELKRKWSADLPDLEKSRLRASIAEAKSTLDECVVAYKEKKRKREAPPSTGGSAGGGKADDMNPDDEPVMRPRKRTRVSRRKSDSDSDSDDCVEVPAEAREAERKQAEAREAERKQAEAREAERKQAEEVEAERKQAEEVEAERKQAEEVEAARLLKIRAQKDAANLRRVQQRAAKKLLDEAAAREKERLEDEKREQENAKARERRKQAKAGAAMRAEVYGRFFPDHVGVVKYDYTDEQLRAALRKMMLKWHPDKNMQNGVRCPVATANSQLLLNARDVLLDPEQRARFDAKPWDVDTNPDDADQTYDCKHRMPAATCPQCHPQGGAGGPGA